eukprot:3629418-Karenia_brevis.AAC.1
MTADRQRKLRSTQRRMLRLMVKVGRRTVTYTNEQGTNDKVDLGDCSDDSSDEKPTEAESSMSEIEDDLELEPFADWIRRATHIAENAFKKIGLEEWVTLQRRWKWRWAGHTARREDGRWSTAVLAWTPSEGSRKPGHPVKRWQDGLDDYLWYKTDAPKGYWTTIAKDRD